MHITCCSIINMMKYVVTYRPLNKQKACCQSNFFSDVNYWSSIEWCAQCVHPLYFNVILIWIQTGVILTAFVPFRLISDLIRHQSLFSYQQGTTIRHSLLNCFKICISIKLIYDPKLVYINTSHIVFL